jgi:quercetin dioxygenase-like cupin family protein
MTTRMPQITSHARYLSLALCTVVIPAFAHAQDAIITLPQEIAYKAPLVGAPEVAVLFGDPTKPGVYVTRVKVPAGVKLMPHWHPDEVRTVVVLSGTFLHGYGDQWDESKLKIHPPGTFFSEPSKAPHFAWAKDEEVVLQITATGPTATANIPQPSR